MRVCVLFFNSHLLFSRKKNSLPHDICHRVRIHTSIRQTFTKKCPLATLFSLSFTYSCRCKTQLTDSSSCWLKCLFLRMCMESIRVCKREREVARFVMVRFFYDFRISTQYDNHLNRHWMHPMDVFNECCNICAFQWITNKNGIVEIANIQANGLKMFMEFPQMQTISTIIIIRFYEFGNGIERIPFRNFSTTNV